MKKKKNYSYLFLVYSLLVFLIASSYATQFIASSFASHKDLGANLFGVYPPYMFLVWFFKFPDSYGIFEQAINYFSLIFIPLFAVALLILIKLSSSLKGNTELHGTAEWAKFKDVKSMGLFNSNPGIFLGVFEHKNKEHYLRHYGPEHTLIVAPTRTGKGVNNVNTTANEWTESIVFLDIKGEIFQMSSGFRSQELGQKILRFEPTDSSGTATKYNPLGEVRINSPYAIKDSQFLAQMLVDNEGKGLKDYWDKAAFDFLAGCVLYVIINVLLNENRKATLLDLSYLMTDKDRNIDELFDTMVCTSDFADGLNTKFNDTNSEYFVHYEKFINAAGRAMLQKADGEKSGVINTTLSFLAIYKDPVINMNTSENDFYINDLINYDTPISLYLIVPPSDIDRIKPLIRFFADILLRRPLEDFYAERKHKLLCLFDEFTSIGKIKQIEYALSYAAGYGIYLMLVCQDLQQIYSTYGKDESITGNCRIKVIFAPANLSTAETFSNMLGKTTIVSRKVSRSGKNNSISMNETARNLMNADELMRLPLMQKNAKGEIIDGGAVVIYVSGKKAIYAKQIVSFKHPEFSRRFKLTAPKVTAKLHEQDHNENSYEIADHYINL